MKYGGLCTYAAVLQIVREHRFNRLLAFLGAAACTALLVVPLAWFWTDSLHLTNTHQQCSSAIAGGTVLGLGAYLNRGCVFGTFVQLTGGNLRYLATLIGMPLGSIAAKLWLLDYSPLTDDASLAAVPGKNAWLWLGFATLVLLLSISRLNPIAASTPRLRLRSIPEVLVMLTLGVGGGWLYAAVYGWDFASVINNTVYQAFDFQPSGPTLIAIFCTLSMVAGGISAAVSQNRFAIQYPQFLPSLHSLVGGSLMGAAAVVLPGGNDGLLLSGIPVFAPHALLGFTFMILSMLVLLKSVPNYQGFLIGRMN